MKEDLAILHLSRNPPAAKKDPNLAVAQQAQEPLLVGYPLTIEVRASGRASCPARFREQVREGVSCNYRLMTSQRALILSRYFEEVGQVRSDRLIPIGLGVARPAPPLSEADQPVSRVDFVYGARTSQPAPPNPPKTPQRTRPVRVNTNKHQ